MLKISCASVLLLLCFVAF